MIASHFTDHPSGTRRYLPALSLWSRVHRWFGRRLTVRQVNTLSVGIIIFIAAVLVATR